MTENITRCRFCDGEVSLTAQKCRHCGEWLVTKQQEQVNVIINNHNSGLSTKSRFIAFILLFFGLHRFYAGKAVSGFLYLVTAGGLGVWLVLDFMSLTTGNFRDSDNLLLR